MNASKLKCPKCSSNNLYRFHDVHVQDFLDTETNRWVRLTERNSSTFEYMCVDCSHMWKPSIEELWAVENR